MSLDSMRPLVVVALVFSASHLPAAPLPTPSPEQVRKELDVLWGDLLSADELTAAHAMLQFATRTEHAVNYLKEKLSPLKLSKERASQLLADLAGDDEKAQRAAFDEFTYFDPRLALGDKELREALLDRPVSRRLGAVLCDLPIDALEGGKWHWYSPDNKVWRFNHGEAIRDRDAAIEVAGLGPLAPKSSWRRAVRAVALLEHISTPGAVAILKDMATGHPDAAPTKAATIALERMRKK
jgi:hypothetical protein